MKVLLKSVSTEIQKVVCGFPGVGKSYFYKIAGLRVKDSDSSLFPKSAFPGNYIAHIQSVMNDFDHVLVSSHQDVRSALQSVGIPFTLVYPQIELKAEYMERYKLRGSPDAFLSLMDNNWDAFVGSCMKQVGCNHIVLGSGQFLSDKLSSKSYGE